jgi:hypothetical protein
MSGDVIFVLMYLRHKRLVLIYHGLLLSWAMPGRETESVLINLRLSRLRVLLSMALECSG